MVLLTLAGAGSGQAREPAPSPAQKVYLAFCQGCHGATGQGDGLVAANLPRPPPDFSSVAWQRTRTDDQIKDAIRSGMTGKGGSTAMPAFEKVLTKAQVDQVTALIRVMDGM